MRRFLRLSTYVVLIYIALVITRRFFDIITVPMDKANVEIDNYNMERINNAISADAKLRGAEGSHGFITSQGERDGGKNVNSLTNIRNQSASLNKTEKIQHARMSTHTKIENRNESALKSSPLGTRHKTVPQPINIIENSASKNVIHNNFSKFLFDRDFSKKKEFAATLSSSTFLIENPNLCNQNKEVIFLLLVHSDPSHFHRRKAIRETYANKFTFRNIAIKVAFLLGFTSGKKNMADIEAENRKYHDIVQGDFLDTNLNASQKGIMGFNWMVTNCPMADLVIKVNDDVYVNMVNVALKVFPWMQNRKYQFSCEVADGFPIHRAKDPWGVSADEFPHFDIFPRFCRGSAVFMSPDLVIGLLLAARKVPLFWMEDVYLFGMLPLQLEGLNVQFYTYAMNFTQNEKECGLQYESNEPLDFLVCKVTRVDRMFWLWKHGLRRNSEQNRDVLSKNILQAVDNFARKFPPISDFYY